MLIAILFFAAAVLFFLSIKIGFFDKKAELGEGVFSVSERTWDLGGFVERGVRVFWFDGYCKSCLEKDGQPNFKKGSMYGNCFICVPFQAKNKSSFFPQEGDSIEIIGKKRFGKLISYRMEKTDFAERYPDHKRSGEDKYKGAFFDAMNERRDDIPVGMDFLGAAKRRGERQGKTAEQFLQELMNTVPSWGPECLLPWEVEEVARSESGCKVLPPDRLKHVKNCNFCRSLVPHFDPDTPPQ